MAQINETATPGSELPLTAILRATGGTMPYFYEIVWDTVPAPDITFVVNNENEVRISVGADVPMAVYNGTIRGIVTDTAGRVRVADLPVTITVEVVALTTCGALTSWSVAEVEPLVRTSAFATNGTYAVKMVDDGSLIFAGAPFEVSVNSTGTRYDGAITVYEDGAGDFQEIEKFSHTVSSNSNDMLGGSANLSIGSQIIESNATGSVVIAGAVQYYEEQTIGPDTLYTEGGIFIFNRVGDDYQQVAKLTMLDTDPLNGGVGESENGGTAAFGHAIALRGDGSDGSYLFVGAPHEYVNAPSFDNPGYVHVFERIAGTWQHIQRMDSGEATNLTFGFGYNLRLSRDGNTLVIYLQYGPTLDWGSYRVYRWNEGTSEMELYAVLPTNQDRQYSAMAISDDGSRILTGNWWTGGIFIWNDNGNGTFSSTQLIPSNLTGNAGYSVALCGTGEVAMVGDPDSSLVGPTGAPGAAFVFKETDGIWAEEELFVCPLDGTVFGGTGSTLFGFSMDLSQDGTVASIGAPNWPFASQDQRGALTIIRGI